MRSLRVDVRRTHRPGLGIGFDVERNFLTFDEVQHAKLLKFAHKNEHVVPAVIGIRLRDDREFFKASFAVAVKILDTAIRESGIEIRTLNALAALGLTD